MRVSLHTPEHVNEMIRRRTQERVQRLAEEGLEAINYRLDELEREWDIERTLEANAAVASLVGLTLGATVHKGWFVFPGGGRRLSAATRGSGLVSAGARLSATRFSHPNGNR